MTKGEGRRRADDALRVLKKLFARSICVDFRKPVVNMFPELAQTYLAVVKEPMDLGTLLLRVSQGLDDVHEIRRCLHLIFSNALAFNEGSYQMEAISNHVNAFAKGLWEEALRMPYENELMHDAATEQFLMTRIEARNERYAFVGKQVLLPSELKDFLKSLNSVSVEDAFSDVHSQIISNVTHAIDQGNKVTFPLLLAPLLEEISNGSFDRVLGGSTWTTIFPALLGECGLTSASHLSDNAFKFVMLVYDAMGEVLVSMCERSLRGSPGSLIWSRGHRPFWALPPKSPWWPCSILLGGNVPDAIAFTNLSRIPESIAKVLAKLRPKVTSNMNLESKQSVFCVRPVPTKILNPPDGYVLVEFFGSHDFGWVKTENIAPITEGLIPPGTVPGKSCSPESLTEVKDYIEWINISQTIDSEVDIPTDDASVASLVNEIKEKQIESNTIESLPKEETPHRSKRKYKESGPKPPEYLPSSLFLSNNVVIPSFRAIPENSSKKEAALHRTRLLVSWVNFSKPLGSHRGRSPFVEHATPEPSPALPVIVKAQSNSSAKTSSGSKSSTGTKTAPNKSSLAQKAASISKIVIPRPSKKKKEASGQDVPSKRAKTDDDTYARDDDSSTLSVADSAYQIEEKTASAFTAVSCSVTSVAGEGIVHTNFIDLNSSIFFREHKNNHIRKKILSHEIQRLKGTLYSLRNEVQSRMNDPMQSSLRTIPILPRKVIVNPGRSGGVAVGNAKIGLARSFIEAEVRAAELWRSGELINIAPTAQTEMAL